MVCVCVCGGGGGSVRRVSDRAVTYVFGKIRTLAKVSGNLPCPDFSSLSGKLSAANRDTINSSRSL